MHGVVGLSKQLMHLCEGIDAWGGGTEQTINALVS